MIFLWLGGAVAAIVVLAISARRFFLARRRRQSNRDRLKWSDPEWPEVREARKKVC